VSRAVYGVGYCGSCFNKLTSESFTNCPVCGSTTLYGFQPKPPPEPRKFRHVAPEPTPEFPNRELPLFWEGSNRWIRNTRCLLCPTCKSYRDLEAKDRDKKIKPFVYQRHAGRVTKNVKLTIHVGSGRETKRTETKIIESRARKAIRKVQTASEEFKEKRRLQNRTRQRRFQAETKAIHPKTRKLVAFNTAERFARRHGLPRPKIVRNVVPRFFGEER
jgi:hypothetical protein